MTTTKSCSQIILCDFMLPGVSVISRLRFLYDILFTNLIIVFADSCEHWFTVRTLIHRAKKIRKFLNKIHLKKIIFEFKSYTNFVIQKK